MTYESRKTIRDVGVSVAETLAYLHSLNPAWVYDGRVDKLEMFSLCLNKEI